MGKTIRIVIAEDHTILREGLRSLLSAHPPFEIVGEAQDGREAIQKVERTRPDILLLDLSMPRMDGMAAIREIRKNAPDTRILVLTVHKEEEYIVEALRSGADGYLLKDATHSELVIALESLRQGKRYVSPGISESVIEGFLEGRRTGGAGAPARGTLTQREREILKLVAEGHRNKEVADYLCISVKTVEKHRANLMKKLDIHNVSTLTAFAIEKGMVTR